MGMGKFTRGLPTKQNEGSSSDSDKLANKWLVPLFRLSEIYLIAIESTTDLAEANRLYSEYMLARNVQVDNYFTSLGNSGCLHI